MFVEYVTENTDHYLPLPLFNCFP